MTGMMLAFDIGHSNDLQCRRHLPQSLRCGVAKSLRIGYASNGSGPAAVQLRSPQAIPKGLNGLGRSDIGLLALLSQRPHPQR